MINLFINTNALMNYCLQLTENIEAALGTVISTKKTSEYYEVKETITETIDETTDTGSVDGYGGNKWSNW